MSVFHSVRGIGRREFLAFGAGTFVVATLPLAMQRRRSHGALVRRALPVMGTIAEVAVAHRDMQVAQDAIDAAFRELQWVEHTMTRFNDTSDVGRANLFAARSPVPVDPATALVVTEALRWADATQGAYDPAVGGIVRLWDVLNRHEPPPSASLVRLASRGLHHKVEVGTHRSAPVLLFHDPDVSIDLGAIAKGYAVDRATNVLRQRGIEKALVEAGGDLYAIGTAPDGEAWRIGVRDPNDTRAIAGTLSASDEAIATSGTYYRFFKWRGRRYHHLMDPEIAEPRHTPLQSLTIRADSCMHADVAATAVFGMAKEDADALLRRVQPNASIASML